MSYYEPTLLFRQNAIRRSPYSSPTSSTSQLCIPDYPPANHTNWGLNSYKNDTEILNKVCNLDRLNIESNYWKIPDNEMNLTSMTIRSNKNNSGYTGGGGGDFNDNAIMAISSGNKQNNLFIYELNLANNYLMHHNTISLPNIYSMKWVPRQNNLLMTGNNKGYGHLISTPNVSSETGNGDGNGHGNVDDDEESAEILKRFNHRKHLRSINKDPSITNHSSTLIEKMEFIETDKLISIYDNNLFNWDLNDATSSSKPKPKTITSINGLSNFDYNKFDNNLISIVGNFGISLFDLRESSNSGGNNGGGNFSIPNSLKSINSKNKLLSNIIKWNPENEYIFASGHLDGIIRLWDIRKQENFSQLIGHNNKIINTLDWIDGDLFSGGKDGNIIHWDLTTDLNNNNLFNCSLKDGLNSVNFDPVTNSSNNIINQRQCGTVLPASNSNIIHLETFETFEDLKVLSIDGSSFFGLHSKIYDPLLPNSKSFYSKDDLNLMINETSNITLVDDEEPQHDPEIIEINDFDFTKPLNISRKPTMNTSTLKNMKLINDSNDTLLDDEFESSTSTSSPKSKIFDSPNALDSPNSNYSLSYNSNLKNKTFDTIFNPDPSIKGHKYQLLEIVFDDFTFGLVQ